MKKLLISLFLISSLAGFSQTIQKGQVGYTTIMNGTWKVPQSYTYTDADSLKVVWYGLLTNTLATAPDLVFFHIGSGQRTLYVSGGGDTAYIKKDTGDDNHIITTLSDSSLKISHGNCKSISDGNYTILNTDHVLIFGETASVRTLTLPTASTMPNKDLILQFFVSGTSEWTLSGSFKQKQSGTDTTPFTEDFINSGIPAGYYHLISINDNGTWRWVDMKP